MPSILRHPKPWLLAFWNRAYRENITGLSGMVAYNLMLAVFPFALLVLFVFGQVLKIGGVESSVLADLQRLFPNTEQETLADILGRIEGNSTTIGIAAFAGSLWIGASFWGAMDTAFCRIYHVECRKWVEQKRFALTMLVVILLLMAATVAVPAAQGILTRGAEKLPFGLEDVNGVVYTLTLLAGLVVLFGILCLIYLTVPNRIVPWRAVWPGALAGTAAMGIVDYVFPVYLGGTPLRQVGTVVVFVVILLVWFYALSFIILGGALINAHRFEAHDTGHP
jgi:YihY family inner membrane protein